MKRLLWNKHTRLMLKHLLGWSCIILGIIQGFLPFLQGWVFIILGVFLLADEVPLFGRIKAWLHRKFPKISNYAHRKGEQMKSKFHHESD